jgi:hypothetical protein
LSIIDSPYTDMRGFTVAYPAALKRSPRPQAGIMIYMELESKVVKMYRMSRMRQQFQKYAAATGKFDKSVKKQGRERLLRADYTPSVDNE